MANKLLRIACALIGACVGVPTSHASGPILTTITIMVANSEGIGFIYPAASPPAYATCASQLRYAINLATPGGQGMWATALTSFKTHSQVSFLGKNTCDVWGDTESLEYVWAYP